MAFLVFGFQCPMRSFVQRRANNGYRLNTQIKQECSGLLQASEKRESFFYGPDTENLDLSMTEYLKYKFIDNTC